MKAKKIFAVLAGTALVTAMAISATACNSETGGLSKSKLNLSNYAKTYESNYNYDEVGLKQLTTVNDSEIYSTSYGLIVTYKSGSYSVYSLAFEKQILSGLSASPSVRSVNGMSYLVCEGSGTVNVYTPDGKTITSYANSYENSLYTDYNYYYVDGESTLTMVYTFTVSNYYTGAETNTHVRANTDDNGKVTSYEIVSENRLAGSGGSDYQVGDAYNGLLKDVYPESKDNPVEGEITKYQYSYFGDTYTFYKDGKATGSVSVKNGEKLAFVGNYMYYCRTNPVASDSNKYDVVINSGSTEIKAKYVFARYDIVKNSDKVLGYDLVVDEMYPIYNKNTSSYDAAVAVGYEKVDGVAFYGTSKFTFLVDSEFKFVGNLNGVSASSSMEIYNVGNGNYYIDGYVFDKDLNVINKADGIYDKLELIRFSNNGYYGFTDLNGKVVIEPKYRDANSSYSTITFYGDAAYVAERQSNGSSKNAILKTDGTVKYIDDLEKTSGSEYKYVSVQNGVYVVTTNSGISTTSEIYTLGGTLLKKVSSSCNFLTYNGETYLTVNDNGTVTYFKLA